MKGKSLWTLMQERQNRNRMQEIARHPNRNLRGVVTLPDPPDPPIFAEPAAPSKGLPDALAGLVNREFLATQTWKDQQQRAVRDGAHPKVLKFEAAFVRRMQRIGIPMRSEERRVGKEWVRTCRSRGAPFH